MMQTADKLGPVNCIRYRSFVEIQNDSDAEEFAKEVTEQEIVRIEDEAIARSEHPTRITVATHRLLREYMRCKPYREGGRHGVEFHRYYVGAALTIDEHGTGALSAGCPDDPLEFQYQILPLAQLFGRRLHSVWGLDGKPGNWQDRESSATRALVRKLLETHGGTMPMGGSSLPMVEIRSIKIDDDEVHLLESETQTILRLSLSLT
jgi:hypothetical protein